MTLATGRTFPFEMAEQIAVRYESLAGMLDSQAEHQLRAFIAPDDEFTGAHADNIRQRVGDLVETGHNLADDARQAAGAIRDLIAEARLAAQREAASEDGSPAPLHRPPGGPRRAI